MAKQIKPPVEVRNMLERSDLSPDTLTDGGGVAVVTERPAEPQTVQNVNSQTDSAPSSLPEQPALVRALAAIQADAVKLRAMGDKCDARAGEVLGRKLTNAFEYYAHALADESAADALRADVRDLGLKLDRRNRLEHFAVRLHFPNDKRPICTAYAKAVRSGMAKKLSVATFADIVHKRDDQKGGYSALGKEYMNFFPPPPGGKKKESAPKEAADQAGVTIISTPEIQQQLTEFTPNVGDEAWIRVKKIDDGRYEIIACRNASDAAEEVLT
jgi:hypothetical protein